VHQNAFYKHQILAGLEIGARCGADLPSEAGFYDGDGGEGIPGQIRGKQGGWARGLTIFLKKNFTARFDKTGDCNKKNPA
jgi:hypothetical protein